MALIPRDYQLELMNIALERNTIIFLPTGSGKTFIAMQVICRMSDALQKKYSEGGKVSIILVNTVSLLHQHFQYLNEQTGLTVGNFSGDNNFNVETDFDKYQVVIMTSQIMVNAVTNNFLDLNKVNIIVFDECHHAVNDQPMRQLMKKFNGLSEPPRVLGLTAVLLIGNSTVVMVPTEVQNLEVTLHSKVATVDGLDQVIKFSTNPHEHLIFFKSSNPSPTDDDDVQSIVISLLSRTLYIVGMMPPEKPQDFATAPQANQRTMKFLSSSTSDLLRFIKDVIYHIELFGPFGGLKACIAFIERLEHLRENCMQPQVQTAISYVLTVARSVHSMLENAMKETAPHLKIERFSSDKVLKLFELIEAQNKKQNAEELCCIIFADRRNTAKVLHLLLQHQSQCHEAFRHVRSKYVVGVNQNSKYKDMRDVEERLEKNVTVLQAFVDKKVNVLVASNVLEEGIDVPLCSLVIKFDKPMHFRSYMQSKGRARFAESLYYILVEEEDKDTYLKKYDNFFQVETALFGMLIGKNQERPQPDDSKIHQMYNEDLLLPYYVDGPDSAHVTVTSAIGVLNQYLSSFSATSTSNWFLEKQQNSDNETLYKVDVVLPRQCPIQGKIRGLFMKSIKDAKRVTAYKTCIFLHQQGELDQHLRPRTLKA